MELVMDRKKIIALIISSMLENTWKSGLGRFLIRKREIKVTVQELEKVKKELNEIVCTIYAEKNVIVPMGSLLGDHVIPTETDDYFYFLLISSRKVKIMISDLTSSLVSGKVISMQRAQNAIVWWFRDLQKNPLNVRYDLEEIEDILRKGG